MADVSFTEEYQERDVLSNTECARANPAADYPPASLRDTANCSPADVAPVTYPDLQGVRRLF